MRALRGTSGSSSWTVTDGAVEGTCLAVAGARVGVLLAGLRGAVEAGGGVAGLAGRTVSFGAAPASTAGGDGGNAGACAAGAGVFRCDRSWWTPNQTSPTTATAPTIKGVYESQSGGMEGLEVAGPELEGFVGLATEGLGAVDSGAIAGRAGRVGAADL
jgi:hypothetical protein